MKPATIKRFSLLCCVTVLGLILAGCSLRGNPVFNPTPTSEGIVEVETPVATATPTLAPEPTETRLPPTPVPTVTPATFAVIDPTTVAITSVKPVATNTPVIITNVPKTSAATTTASPPKTPVPPTPTFRPEPTPNPALKEIARGATGKKQVALTFDAGSDNVAYSLIRNALVKAGVKSTFFLTGEWLSSYPEEAKQLANDGMEFGNHSWSHPNFTTISGEAIRSEVNRTENQLVKVTGKSSKPLLRFPYGARDSRTTGVINQLGYRSIFWSLDSLDSVGQPKTVDFIVQRITGQTDAQLDGAIILMHLGARTSGEALPQIIQNLQARGFKLVTVSQLLK